MGKAAISRKAWRTATDVLLWYPESKREYAELQEELLHKAPKVNADLPYKDRTGDKAIALLEDRRAQRLKTEIDAVESALDCLRPDMRDVIRRRFFEVPASRPYSPRPYDFLQDLPYSCKTMQRISKKVVELVALYLGEA